MISQVSMRFGAWYNRLLPSTIYGNKGLVIVQKKKIQ